VIDDFLDYYVILVSLKAPGVFDTKTPQRLAKETSCNTMYLSRDARQIRTYFCCFVFYELNENQAIL